ncbi:hypothetical protein LPTSP3_g29160 [Leptospira kobayashii]|uniref:Lipoprotein n=1 Tax=Leptospira kobayashii TaxID=1917830 RepID=A0ABN6KLF7_9LEPT|nr:hypothetical protein [Leptospira kobayashii]BDA79986.1 hypothetical protein LPTSP3_g29160 [Leptospira kobayashii]
MFKNLLIVVSLLGFAQCSSVTFKESDLGNDPKIPFTAFNPKPGVDVFNTLRVDIIRQYRTVTTHNANGTVTQRRERVEDQPAGIELGNGLFLDANQNLILSLIDVLGLRNKDKFKVTQKASGFMSNDVTLTKDGQHLTLDTGGILGGKTEYTVTPNSVTIKGGILSSDTVITYDKDSVTYDPKGILGGLSKFTIQRRGNDFVSPGLFWDTVFRFDGKDDSITLGTDLVLQNKKTQMEVTRKFESTSFFSSEINTSTYKFYRTKSTYLMINPQGKGFKATINGKSVNILYSDFWGNREVEIIVE